MWIIASSAHAALVSYATPSDASTGGQPVAAKVTFTTSNNQINIILENLQVDPRSATQCLSGLQFHISTNETSGSLTSSSGLERSIDGNGIFTDGANAATGWALQTVGSDLKLNLLGQQIAPKHTIIGPVDGTNTYAKANSSITNGTHSPFFAHSASFTLNVPGVTAASSISSVTFQFNTAAGNTVAGIIPEPAAAMASLAGICLLRRRR